MTGRASERVEELESLRHTCLDLRDGLRYRLDGKAPTTKAQHIIAGVRLVADQIDRRLAALKEVPIVALDVSEGEKAEMLPIEGKDYRIISAPGEGEMEAVVFESGKPWKEGVHGVDAVTLRSMAKWYGWRIEEIEGGQVRAFVRVDNVVIGGAFSGTITIPDPVDTPARMTSIKDHRIAGALKEGDLFWWEGKQARVMGLPEFSADEEFVTVTLLDGDPESPEFDSVLHDSEEIGVAVELEMIGE